MYVIEGEPSSAVENTEPGASHVLRCIRALHSLASTSRDWNVLSKICFPHFSDAKSIWSCRILVEFEHNGGYKELSRGLKMWIVVIQRHYPHPPYWRHTEAQPHCLEKPFFCDIKVLTSKLASKWWQSPSNRKYVERLGVWTNVFLPRALASAVWWAQWDLWE